MLFRSELLASDGGSASSRLVTNLGREEVLVGSQEEVGDDGDTDLLALEDNVKGHVSGADSKICARGQRAKEGAVSEGLTGGVEESSVGVDLDVARETTEDVDVGDSHWTRVEPLHAEDRGRNGEGNVLEEDAPDAGRGLSYRARSLVAETSGSG